MKLTKNNMIYFLVVALVCGGSQVAKVQAAEVKEVKLVVKNCTPKEISFDILHSDGNEKEKVTVPPRGQKVCEWKFVFFQVPVINQSFQISYNGKKSANLDPSELPKKFGKTVINLTNITDQKPHPDFSDANWKIIELK